MMACTSTRRSAESPVEVTKFGDNVERDIDRHGHDPDELLYPQNRPRGSPWRRDHDRSIFEVPGLLWSGAMPIRPPAWRTAPANCRTFDQSVRCGNMRTSPAKASSSPSRFRTCRISPETFTDS